MSAPDDDRLAELAARLAADDPALARRLRSTPSPTTRHGLLVVAGLATAALVGGGVVTANVPLALLALPVLLTATVLAYGRVLRSAWLEGGHDRSASTGRDDG